jgi:RHS repeat-associated protein
MKLTLMGARWYDSSLGRWTQPDTIVPLSIQGVHAWDRYQYVSSNPLRFIDPSGYRACEEYFNNCENDPPRGYDLKTINQIRDDIRKKYPDIPTRVLNQTPFEGLWMINEASPISQDDLTKEQKVGMYVSIGLLLGILSVIDVVMVALTISVVELGPLALLEVVIIPADIALADIHFSLILQADRSISTGKKHEYQWHIVPDLISRLPSEMQQELWKVLPNKILQYPTYW